MINSPYPYLRFYCLKTNYLHFNWNLDVTNMNFSVCKFILIFYFYEISPYNAHLSIEPCWSDFVWISDPLRLNWHQTQNLLSPNLYVFYVFRLDFDKGWFRRPHGTAIPSMYHSSITNSSKDGHQTCACLVGQLV